MTAVRAWMADQLVRAAAKLTRRHHPDWADAMLSEHASLSDHPDQLGWALGSLRGSVRVDLPSYPFALILALAAMVFYQWSADESAVTLSVLFALSTMLGCLRPSLYVVSGLALGVVVAGVNGFETLSGIRPSYEASRHTWMHDLRWLWLVLPALAGSAIGRRIGFPALERI